MADLNQLFDRESGQCRITSRIAVLHLSYAQTATVGILRMPKVQNLACNMREDVLEHRQKSY